MTVTFDLPPHVEKAYLAAAEARGVGLADVMREVLLALQPSGFERELGPEEWVRQFKTWTASHMTDDFPLLADEDISREAIYRERGL